jgi:hypothetical protein
MEFRVSLDDGGGTVDIFTESREFQVQEESQSIDVTVRGDAAKANLPDLPNITVTVGGLDYIAGSVTNPEWDKLEQGMRGTVYWWPEGTAVGRRQRSLKSIVGNKTYASPYAEVATWNLTLNSDGGTVVKAFVT